MANEAREAAFSCEYSEQNPVYCQQCGGHEHLCRKSLNAEGLTADFEQMANADRPLWEKHKEQERQALMAALDERSRLDPDAPTAIVFKEFSEATQNTMKDFNLTPDWTQIYLNGGPPCFAVMGDDKRFCNRAEWWEGHPSDHKFVSWTDFLFEVMMWGYSAHESAIRTAAAALVESIDKAVKEVDELIRERDFMSPSDFMDSEGRGHGTTLEGWMRSYSDYCIDQAIGNVRWLKNISGVKAKLAALKAELETPTGKEMG